MTYAFGLKAFSIALAGAFALSIATPEDASAQGRSRSAAQRAAEKKQPAAAKGGLQLDRERGGREAPAAVQAAKLTCTVVDAAFIGSSTTTIGGAQVSRNAYEVACQEGLGFFILNPPAGAAGIESLDCLVVQAGADIAKAQGKPPGPVCRLPANAQPAQGLKGLVAQAGATCAVSNGRYVGDLPNGRGLRYEVACGDRPGFLIDRLAAGGKPPTISCLAAADSPAPCTLTTRQQSLAAVAPIVARSGRACTVNNARFAGRSPSTQGEVLEVGCQGTPGFFVELTPAGGYARVMDCGTVGNTPCQFTDDTAARAALASGYTRRLKAAGHDCTVSNFVRMGVETGANREIVEVACSNRPDGAIALFASQQGQRNDIMDCLRGARVGNGCTLTQPSVLYPKLSAAIGARAPRGCQVASSRYMGATAQGENYIEVACADGRSFVVDYRGEGRAQSVLTCRNAAKIFDGCRAGDSASVPKD